MRAGSSARSPVRPDALAQPLGQPRRGRVEARRGPEGVVRELIDVHQARSGDDVLDADAAVHPRQHIEHLNLAARARAPVRMAALRGARDEMPVDVVQHRFAESGSRRDHGGVAARLRDALLQHRQLGRLQHRHGERHRFEVVEDVHVPQRRAARDLRGIHEPRHVGEPRHLVGDRAGDAERRRRDAAPLDAARLQELADHRHQAVVVQRGELADLHGRRPVGRAHRTIRGASWCHRCRLRAAWGPIIANRP